MHEVKRCPFCGKYPVCGVEYHDSDHLAAVVRCTECDFDRRKIFKATSTKNLIPFLDYEIAFDRVVDAWNERYDEKK